VQDAKVSTDASGAENGVPQNEDKPLKTNTDTKASNVEKVFKQLLAILFSFLYVNRVFSNICIILF